MNQSFKSLHPEVDMVSLLYDSAEEQLTVFVQNLKLYYMSTCKDFFTDMSTWKKDLDDSPNSNSYMGDNWKQMKCFVLKMLWKSNISLCIAFLQLF